MKIAAVLSPHSTGQALHLLKKSFQQRAFMISWAKAFLDQEAVILLALLEGAQP